MDQEYEPRCSDCDEELTDEEIEFNESVDAYDDEQGEDSRGFWVCSACSN